MYVVWTSRNLRPIADDYLLGATSQAGLMGAVVHWWSEWTGDLTTTLSNIVLVGLPLVHLPWSIASALPFLFTALLVALFMSWLLVDSQAASDRSARGSWLVVARSMPVLMLMWWGFWWISAVYESQETDTFLLARSLTHWQNLNAAYVVTSTTLVWTLVSLEMRSRCNRGWLLTVAYLGWGLLVGLNGPTFAISMIGVFLVGFFAYLLIGSSSFRLRGPRWLAAIVGISGGALYSHYSPGSQSRKLQLANPEITVNFLVVDMNNAVQAGFQTWWSVFALPSTWVIVFVLVSFAILLRASGFRARGGALLALSFTFLVFSLLLAIAGKVSDLFSYVAFWHILASRLMAWFALCLAGLGVGTAVAARFPPRIVNPLAGTTAVFGICLAGSALLTMVQDVNQRVVQWEVGPAAMKGMGDIDNPAGWQREAYADLRAIRGGPERGLRSDANPSIPERNP